MRREAGTKETWDTVSAGRRKDCRVDQQALGTATTVGAQRSTRGTASSRGQATTQPLLRGRASLKRRAVAVAAVGGLAIVLSGTALVPVANLDMSFAPTAVTLGTQSLSTPTMQPVNLSARPVRVAVVPGTGGAEAWAIGYSSAQVPGWTTGGLGQPVFMHYTSSGGWQVTGPAVTDSGAPSTKQLTSLSVAAGGEGWAVGAAGTLVHHSAGSLEWHVMTPAANGSPLTSVSVVAAPGGAVTGYAVGASLTILHLAAGSLTWQPDTGLPVGVSTDLASVSTVADGEAWAVSGDTSTSLTVYHRSGGSWGTASTETMFSSPSATGTNQAASGAAIAAAGSGAWVVGRMEPNDQTHPLGDTSTGDRSRPFAISITGSGSVRSYCPSTVQPSTTTANGATVSEVCDSDLPIGAFGLTGVAGFGDPNCSEAFATGMGLFRFVPNSSCTGGTWQRENDAVGYLSGLSMANPVEGWMVGTGSNAISGAALSESLAIGHWTQHPNVPAMARWPEPGSNPLEGDALSPDGSGAVLAVGGSGELERFAPGFGWVGLNNNFVARSAFHAIAWPAVNSAWAVGNNGDMAHWDGASWSGSKMPRLHYDDAFTALYGIAFADAGHGWAAGDDGVLLDYAGGWHRNPLSTRLTQQPLYTVVSGGGTGVAAGANGTVLDAVGSTWSVDGTASALAGAGSPNPATIFASASLPDGTVVLGGTGGLLLERSRGGQFSRIDTESAAGSLDGTIVALGLSRDSAGRLQILASVSPHTTSKYVSGNLATTDGYLMVRDGSGWHDIELNHQLTMWASSDAAAAHDPVFAIALERTGMKGWAVGGYPALTLDDDNFSSERDTSSGSVYRVNGSGDPNPPSSALNLPPPPSHGFTFAFLGDSACAAGVCGAALGSGAKADVVLQEAQREIEMSNPDLTFFGGNMRGSGRKEELDIFNRYTQSFTMPFFAAMGGQDLLSALNPNDVVSQAPSNPVGTTDAPYLQEFQNQLEPWGTRTVAGNGIRAVDGNSTQDAATHYAFDYQPPGLPAQVRFIVVNSSDGTLGDAGANPGYTGASNQTTWLNNELSTAHGMTTIVISSSPMEDPRTKTETAAGTTAEPLFAASPSVAAVFASTINDNTKSQLTGAPGVTQYISGGAGSPLDGTVNSLHGYYHSWLLVTVDPDHATDGKPAVSVQSMPVVESVDMRLGYQAAGGSIPAGQSVQVWGIGRLPDAGIGNLNGTASNPTNQSKTDYVQFPPNGYGYFNCTTGTESDGCTVPYAQEPSHHFAVEATGQDPNRPVAMFVQPCPNVSTPLWPCTDNGGKIKPDDAGEFGFLCALNPGKAWIDVTMGVREVRQQITVTSGSGFCNQHPIPEPVIQVHHTATQVGPQPPQPQPVPVNQPAPKPALRPHHPFVHIITNNPVAAVVPPPVPVLAAAPPLPAAGTAAKKEEEREKALEHSKQEGGHSAVIRADADAAWDPRPIAGAGAAALLMFIFMSTWAAGRREPEAAIDERRWE